MRNSPAAPTGAPGGGIELFSNPNAALEELFETRFRKRAPTENKEEESHTRHTHTPRGGGGRTTEKEDQKQLQQQQLWQAPLLKQQLGLEGSSQVW